MARSPKMERTMTLIHKSLAALLALSLMSGAANAVEDIHDYSTTPASNTNVGGVSYAENMLPGLVNDGVRALIAQIKRAVANQGADISSAATTEICATGTSIYAKVTGTTTITSLGTAAAGCWRWIEFTGALTLTHNATSLILPGGVNITTAAGDAMAAVSLGSGNWKVLTFAPISGSVVGGFSSVTATSTDAGAGAGPDISANRNSASAADADLIGRYLFDGRDDASNAQTYCSIDGKIVDSGSTSEDAEMHHKCIVAGTSADRLIVGAGVQVGSAPTGGDLGAGTINADGGIYKDGVLLSSGMVAQVVSDTETTYTTLGTILPLDNSIPQNTEGDEILSVAITPRSASSSLYITMTGMFGGTTTQAMSCALFVDTTANALNATSITVPNTTFQTNMVLQHVVSAASTSARTYKIRCGSAVASDAFLNGDSGGRNFGGVAMAVLRVEEIVP
jgi:hypothetical protein